MSDFKSKLPDFKEVGAMASKLFKGIKASVEEIIEDYKQKRTEPEAEKKPTKETQTHQSESPKKSKKKTEPSEENKD